MAYELPEFEFIYVNHDGSLRELSPGEREYLSARYSGGDGARPYVKRDYKSRNGWGSQSGYILRKHAPPELTVAPVNPNYDELSSRLSWDISKFEKVLNRAPLLTKESRFQILREFVNVRTQTFEALARGSK